MRSLNARNLRARRWRKLLLAVVLSSMALVPFGPLGLIRPAHAAPAVAPAIPLACQSNTTNQTYDRNDNGVVFHVTIAWTRNFDCSHWANSVSIQGSGYILTNITTGSGAYSATLEDTNNNVYATSIYNGCFGTYTTYTNYFSGNNVPSTKVPDVFFGVGQPDCQHNFAVFNAIDTVN
jgi:hypothetical protein